MHYVYIFKDANGAPYYVGKGSGRRYRKREVRDSVPIPENLDMIEIVKDNMTESEAFELEIEIIAKYGRIQDGGTLLNITKGGKGSLGRSKSPEEIRKISRSVSRSRIGNSLAAKTWKLKKASGEEFLIRNLSEWCRANGFDRSGFSMLFKGKIKSYKGFTGVSRVHK